MAHIDQPARRVAIYGRVSTDDQQAEGQILRLREWAGRAGFDVAIEEKDVASGRRVVRPGQEHVMAEARGHHVHAVAVAKIDRWARSMQHLASTVEELHQLGVDFYAVDQGLSIRADRADPTSRLMLQILGAVAEWEASIISERTKEGLRGKVGRGRHPVGCGIETPCPTEVHCSRCGSARCRRVGGEDQCRLPRETAR